MEVFRPFLSFAKTSSNISDILELNYKTAEEISEIGNNEDNERYHLENNSNGNITDRECEQTSQDISSTGSAISESPLSSITATSTPTGTGTRKRARSSTNPKQTSSVDSLINYFQTKKKTDMDATELLFLAHARTVKTFSGKRQAITKMKIAQVIMEQELQHQEELLSTQENSSSGDASGNSYYSKCSDNTAGHREEISPPHTVFESLPVQES